MMEVVLEYLMETVWVWVGVGGWVEYGGRSEGAEKSKPITKVWWCAE